MNEKTIDKIDNLFTAHETKNANAQADRESKRREHSRALVAFRKVVGTIIKPQMTTLGNHLKSKGMKFKIDLEKERYETDGTLISPEDICLGIFKIYTKEIFSEYDYCRYSSKVPRVTFELDVRTNKIKVFESDHMAEEYELNAITDEVIDKHVVNVLARAGSVINAQPVE